MAEITLNQACDDTGLSRSYIGRLARLGIIKGRKIGPMWLVDSDSLKEYTSQYHKPGPRKPPAPERQEVSAAHAG
jgi:hypothetical protein